MKDSRQWANEIEEKLNMMYAARRKRRKRILQATSIAACFLVVLSCLFVLPEIFLAPISTPPKSVENNEVSQSTPPPNMVDNISTDNPVPEAIIVPKPTAILESKTDFDRQSSTQPPFSPQRNSKADSTGNKTSKKEDDSDSYISDSTNTTALSPSQNKPKSNSAAPTYIPPDAAAPPPTGSSSTASPLEPSYSEKPSTPETTNTPIRNESTTSPMATVSPNENPVAKYPSTSQATAFPTQVGRDVSQEYELPVSDATNSDTSLAKKKTKTSPRLSETKITIRTSKKKTATLKVKNTKKNSKWSIVSGKKNLRLAKKQKYRVQLIATRRGKATIRCKIGKYKLYCNVIIRR